METPEFAAKTFHVLLKAAEVIDRGWTQGRSARDADGGGRLIEDPFACQFCASGAIRRAVLDLVPFPNQIESVATKELANYLLATKRVPLCEDSESVVINWNDCRGRHAKEVSDALRSAAENMMDKLVHYWHGDPKKQPLHVWLGFTWEEYSAYVERRRK